MPFMPFWSLIAEPGTYYISWKGTVNISSSSYISMAIILLEDDGAKKPNPTPDLEI
jgi:hypothetical protein